MMNVVNQMIRYGPNGVPKGLVETQNSVNGSTPCLLQTDIRFNEKITQHRIEGEGLPSNFSDHARLADHHGY